MTAVSRSVGSLADLSPTEVAQFTQAAAGWKAGDEGPAGGASS